MADAAAGESQTIDAPIDLGLCGSDSYFSDSDSSDEYFCNGSDDDLLRPGLLRSGHSRLPPPSGHLRCAVCWSEQLVVCFSRRRRDAHRAHCINCVLRWGSNFSEARSRHHSVNRYWSWWRQWRGTPRLVCIDDMMEALGATECIEGDRGNYRHASLHDEFGPFNTRWKVDTPEGTYCGGSAAFSFYWRSVVDRLALKELGIVCPGRQIVREVDREPIGWDMPHGRDHDHEW